MLKKIIVAVSIFMFFFSPVSTYGAEKNKKFSLKISYILETGAVPINKKVLCRPPAGNYENPKEICRKLLSLKGTLRPLSLGTVCTEQYGGPGIIKIRGYWYGKKINLVYSKVNGCEISRWNKIEFLLH